MLIWNVRRSLVEDERHPKNHRAVHALLTGALNLVFDPAAQQVAFYNTDTAKVSKAKPELSVPVSFQPGQSYDFTLLIDGTVAVLYINDQMALSTRMYGLPEHQWGIFSTDSEVFLNELRSSKF